MTNEQSKKTSKLTAKQECFCREYLVDLNATQAATRAGYSDKTAREQAARMLSKVNIQERIQHLMQERSKATQVTAEYVLTSIVDTIERCKQAEPVLDKDGKETGVYKFDSQAVLKGCELLGKHLSIFTDKVKLQGDPDNPPFPTITVKIEQ